MDALLVRHQPGRSRRGLQFELFKPGQVEIKEYYAELPIAIKVVGVITTSVRLRPTWPTCRASSRCTT
jgi:Tfp pilus assembly protein PilO